MKNLNRPSPRARGFTLIELLVVIVILGILAALIVPRVIGREDDAKVGAATADVATLISSLETFRADCGRYPTTEEGLDALRSAPSDLQDKWKGPYLQQPVDQDPWQHPYVYKCPADGGGTDSCSVTSYGKDGQEGGTGNDADITKTDGA